jgi:tetratricopeptide (TPR) repeat protein
MPYDLFISYSRDDDKRGQVRALKEQIESDYRSFAGEELRCFFDLEDIATMDDWKHRILDGLRDSNLLLLVLSPAYLVSPYCEWEIIEFLKYEHSRSVGGQGVTPVYFVEIPGLDEPGFEQRAAAWLARVRRRNQVDLRPWFHEGAEALKQAEVRTRLDDLERSLHTRLSRLRRLREAPGNLPAHNPRFVGREAEMQRLHEAVGLGRFGVLTAVQGMGGVGKTALAIQYAYAYADFYPGGRWLVGCAGETHIASALRRLDLDLGLTLNDAEKRDDTLAARRVLAELERRAIEGARTRAGEKDPPRPKTLLLLDNVDHPALLQPPHSDLLTGRQWLHVLATTRSGAEDFGNDPERLTVLSIDELPDDDALRLIESYQPHGRFPTSQERDAALALVKLLGGFTLAIEVVAMHLLECAGRVTCAAFLERMKKEGIGSLDGIFRGTKGGIRHGEKLIGATLKPTLDLLTEPERLVLSYAGLLPPDTIPLPWLRALAANDFPELGRDAEPGYDDPWLSLVNHLLGLRLVQTVDLATDGRTPRLLRLHRLVGEVVRQPDQSAPANEKSMMRFPSPPVRGQLENHRDDLRSQVSSFVEDRCHDLRRNWHENLWEIAPLVAYTRQLLAQRDANAPAVVRTLCHWLINFDYGRDSAPILRSCLAQQEANPDTKLTHLGVTLNDLGHALFQSGQYPAAEGQMRRALEIDERIVPTDEHRVSIRCNNLGSCLKSEGKLAEAEALLRRALELAERVLPADAPHRLICVNNLAGLLDRKGDHAAAAALHRRNLENSERALGLDHPLTLMAASNLAVALFNSGDSAAAEPLYQRALEGRERVLGLDHPETLLSLYCMALLLKHKGDYRGAERLFRRTLEASERVLGPAHPDTLENISALADLLEARERVSVTEHPKNPSSMTDPATVRETTNPPDEARTLRLRRLALLAAQPDIPPRTLHELARDCFVLGDYPKAEELLNRLLQAGFEPASTRHHLARVCLITDRLAEAREHVAQAWSARADAQPYLIARLLWFQLALALLEAVDKEEDGMNKAGLLLGRLKTALQNDTVFMEWNMQPVLDHLKPRLPTDACTLLAALVAALSFKEKVAELEVIPAWREATPQPLA